MTTRPTQSRKSDLGVRTLSAIVMLAVAGGALWLGGWWWAGFVALISIGVLWEWRALVRGFAQRAGQAARWNLAGFIYVGVVAATMLWMRGEVDGDVILLILVGMVAATDVGAYFAGRTIGGPKIAPKISPSKTWAGLAGGIFGAALVPLAILAHIFEDWHPDKIAVAVIAAAIVAVLAQTGDFFESWMKRRAGVKDSGKLLPGHGGLFDRLDGLLAVLFVFGIVAAIVEWWPQDGTPDHQIIYVEPR